MPIPNTPSSFSASQRAQLRDHGPDATSTDLDPTPSLSSQLLFPLTILLCAVFLDFSSRMLVASLERASLFTILLQQSRYMHFSRALLAILFAIAALQFDTVLAMRIQSNYFLHVTLAGLFCIGIYAYLAPAWADASYVRVRWAAWSGMSRTGIAPRLVQYLPQTKERWEEMSKDLAVAMDPADKVISLWPFGSSSRSRRNFIGQDPTALLIAAHSIEKQNSQTSPTGIGFAKSSGPGPAESVVNQPYPVNVYRPLGPSKSASLLWGEQISFSRRISRGIISLPRHLLSTYPTLSSGVPAHGLVLAFGILARNKGLAPVALVCGLTNPTSVRIFEEDSARYPRPAKTLRSYYRAETEIAFGTLGAAYVAAGTELGLILSDTPHSLILEWLGQNLEHQDLLLNIRAQELGATDEELDRLYRGSYAAMLVSLNMYNGGKVVRPEILVFEEMCRRDGVELPEWVKGNEMRDRRILEVQSCGGEQIVDRLVRAAV